jgi:LRR receptor-like serine/threonine-protein kinase FLS2
MTGNLTEEICKVKSLSTLYLGGNQFTGIIPTCIGDLVNLEIFDVADNLMAGKLPDSIGNIAGLQQLYLHFEPR